MLKSLLPKFRLSLSVRLMDITEKQVPTKLKPIVDAKRKSETGFSSVLEKFYCLLDVNPRADGGPKEPPPPVVFRL